MMAGIVAVLTLLMTLCFMPVEAQARDPRIVPDSSHKLEHAGPKKEHTTGPKKEHPNSKTENRRWDRSSGQSVSVVPEPATLTLVVVGIGGLAARAAWRRRHQ